jgi:hypothetical protein
LTCVNSPGRSSAYQIDLVRFGVLMAIALAISGRLAKVDQLRVFWANWPSL